MQIRKIQYFLESGAKRFLGKGAACPSCGETRGSVVDTKYAVTQLRRCQQCRLLFRVPTTSSEESRAFYQRSYSQGFTTSLPSEAELRLHVDSGFNGEKSYKAYIDVLDALGCQKGERLLDFGCSWGYGSWQLARHGFVVQSFEISQPRAQYAQEKLGVNLVHSLNDAQGPFDVFFSAHVFEHVPSVASAIGKALLLLRPGGLFVAFTPNGASTFRNRDPWAWHKLWGLVHPQLLDDEFYAARFSDRPCVLASSPYQADQLKRWDQSRAQLLRLDLSGGELLCAVRT